MSPRKKTIKVSDEEYHLIQRARRELQRKGYEKLDLNDVAKEEDINLGDLLAGLALGAIAAAGVIALLKMLSGEE